MRVVVTRPELSAARTAERLKTMGHDPVLLPLSQAIHHPQAAAEALGMPHSALAVTSAEAMRVLLAPEMRRSIDPEKQVFAVGEATAAAADAIGFHHVLAGPGDGKDLADLIAASPNRSKFEILYLAGTPRARTFEERCEALGISLRIAEIYEMAAIDYAPADLATLLTDPPSEAVLLYSQENALRFFDLTAPHADMLAGMRILCLSERTAAKVPERFTPRIEVAERPTEDALLALL